MYVLNPEKNLDKLFIRKSGTSLLILDYDGTIAPFKLNRDEAVPDPEIHAKIESIASMYPACRLVIVSGRKADEVKNLLKLTAGPLDIWGSHGWERMSADGSYIIEEPSNETRAAIEMAMGIAKAHGLAEKCEFKPASIALHTRGLDDNSVRKIEKDVVSQWKEIAKQSGLSVAEFDGGFELIDRSKNKGTAVRTILEEAGEIGRACYIGDDRTDEDAFRAIASRGFAILYNKRKQDTLADIILESRREFLDFLERWLNTCGTKD